MKSINVTQYVYMNKWSLKELLAGGEASAKDLCVYDTDKCGNDYTFLLCPIEIAVDIPTEEEYRLMELAGCEAELAREQKQALAKMAALSERIEQLKALPAPEVDTRSQNPYANVDDMPF